MDVINFPKEQYCTSYSHYDGTDSCPFCHSNDKSNQPNYCNICMIIWRASNCLHSSLACDYDSYFIEFIESFVFNKKKYIGMPMFKSFKKANDFISTNEVIWKCVCPKCNPIN